MSSTVVLKMRPWKTDHACGPDEAPNALVCAGAVIDGVDVPSDSHVRVIVDTFVSVEVSRPGTLANRYTAGEILGLEARPVGLAGTSEMVLTLGVKEILFEDVAP